DHARAHARRAGGDYYLAGDSVDSATIDFAGASQVRRTMLQLQRLSDGLGLHATGVDLTRPLSAEHFAAIEAAFHQGQVLVLPEQALTAAQFVAFARYF